MKSTESPMKHADGGAEGDVNLSPQRLAWSADISATKPAHCWPRMPNIFLHQSLSTPCLNVLRHVEGAWIEDIEGPTLSGFSRQLRASSRLRQSARHRRHQKATG
ncbi:MAG: hypothetical protein WDM76_16755 [Limisphaerales bacterium]